MVSVRALPPRRKGPLEYVRRALVGLAILAIVIFGIIVLAAILPYLVPFLILSVLYWFVKKVFGRR